jgi:maleylacetate reductase
MRWNKPANADRQMLVATAMGEVMDRFSAGLDTLRSLRLVKIGPESFECIAEQAMGTPWVPHNPEGNNQDASAAAEVEL